MPLLELIVGAAVGAAASSAGGAELQRRAASGRRRRGALESASRLTRRAQRSNPAWIRRDIAAARFGSSDSQPAITPTWSPLRSPLVSVSAPTEQPPSPVLQPVPRLHPLSGTVASAAHRAQALLPVPALHGSPCSSGMSSPGHKSSPTPDGDDAAGFEAAARPGQCDTPECSSDGDSSAAAGSWEPPAGPAAADFELLFQRHLEDSQGE
eukprot:TRINITY_DN4980_c0_g2_i1.p3 TRINITY_DN4980_c0_g2~~TRINITY_DN4980_c0_g2_i1.p3  ORF type:complete len:210 (+),score=72.24 TRINITY_DN4980_c0_g2_i1:93-722(+)